MLMNNLVILLFVAGISCKEIVGVQGESGLWSKPSRIGLGPLQQNSVAPDMKHIPQGTNEEKSFLDSVRMPGTAWCGKGWRTDSYTKLGGYSSADRCCRQHDLGCDDSIQPGQTKYGLTNMRFHTVMHCKCDDRFRSCLKMTSSASGDTVGNMFFNVAHIPCFISKKTEVCVARNWWRSCLETRVIEKAVWRSPMQY